MRKTTLGIPTSNRVISLLNLLDSLLLQTFKDFDVLISDDGGFFDIETIIKKYKNKLDIKYIKGKRINLPLNRQNIFNNSISEFVFMCDDDHYLEPDCLEHLYETITNDERVGMVSAIWPDNRDIYSIDYQRVKNNIEYSVTLEDVNENSAFNWKNSFMTPKVFYKPNRLIKAQMLGGGCLIYRRKAVLAAGGFPSNYSSVSFREDTDMSYRVFLSGYNNIINPRAIAYHYKSNFGGTRNSKNRKKILENDGKMFLKNISIFKKTGKVNIAKNIELPDEVINNKKSKDFELRISKLLIDGKIEEVYINLKKLREDDFKSTLRNFEIILFKIIYPNNLLRYALTKQLMWKIELSNLKETVKALNHVRRKSEITELKAGIDFIIGELYLENGVRNWHYYLKKGLQTLTEIGYDEFILKSFERIGDLCKKYKKKQYKQYYEWVIDALIRKNDNSESEKYRIASLFKRLGDYKKAEGLFKSLLKLSSNNSIKSGIFFHLGEIELMLGNKKKAKRNFEKCVKLNMGHIKARGYLESNEYRIIL